MSPVSSPPCPPCPPCPLSGSANTALVSLILSADLINLYRIQLGLDVAGEFDGAPEIGLYRCADSDLRFFHPAAAGSGSFYERLQTFDWYYQADKYEFGFARNYIGAADRVLDVGCGSGAFAAHVGPGNFVGLELNASARNAAVSKGVTVLDDSVQRHAEQNRSRYDAVCAFQVLEHIGGLRSFVQACVDCLKPGGRLIFAVPSYDSFVSCMTNYALNLPPHHVSWWSDEALRRLAGVFALDVVALVHEPLSAVHKRLYCSVLAGRALGLSGAAETAPVDLSMRFRVLSKLAWTASWFLERGLTDDRLLPHGHTVMAVYKKRQS